MPVAVALFMGGKRKARRKVASPCKPASTAKAKEHFVKGVIVRGEAGPKDKALTPGATHEVTGTDRKGNPTIQRKRFSIA